VPWWQYDPDAESTDIRGEDALRAAGQILPLLNAKGASARVVSSAVKLAAENEDPKISFETAAKLAASRTSWNDFGREALISRLPSELRLALEMISHEDSERRALEGELHILEAAWRDAEEIAEISDNLFLPSEVSTKLTDLKRGTK
jgi:hypothetical protein